MYFCCFFSEAKQAVPSSASSGCGGGVPCGLAVFRARQKLGSSVSAAPPSTRDRRRRLKIRVCWRAAHDRCPWRADPVVWAVPGRAEAGGLWLCRWSTGADGPHVGLVGVRGRLRRHTASCNVLRGVHVPLSQTRSVWHAPDLSAGT